MRQNTARRAFGVGMAITLFMAFAAASPGARADDLTVEVSGRRVDFGGRHEAYRTDGEWLIPAMAVLRAADVRARYDSDRKVLRVTVRRDELEVEVGRRTVYGGDRRDDRLPVAVAEHHGEPYVPIVFLERCTGLQSRLRAGGTVLSFGSGGGGGGGEYPSRDTLTVIAGDRTVRFSRDSEPYKRGLEWMLPIGPTLDSGKVRTEVDDRHKEIVAIHGPLRWTISAGSRRLEGDRGRTEYLPAEIVERRGEYFAPVAYFEHVFGRPAEFDRRRSEVTFLVRRPGGTNPFRPAEPEDAVKIVTPRRGSDVDSGRVRIDGTGSGREVRVKVYSRDGHLESSDTVSFLMGNWSTFVRLEKGDYQVVAELLVKGTVRATDQIRFTVRGGLGSRP